MRSSVFCRELQPMQAVRPYMVAGVLEKDYPGERTEPAVRAYVNRMFAQAETELRGREYREFDAFTLCDIPARWTVCDAPSPKYAAGHYFIMEKLALMPILFQLESDAPQEVRIRFDAGRLLVLRNGETCFDNRDFFERKRPRRYVFEHEGVPAFEDVSLRLEKGLNTVIALTGHVNRSTGISFSMKLLACDAGLRARVPLNMPPEIREEIFMSHQETHLEDDNYLVGETPRLFVGRMPMSACRAFVRVTDGKSTPLMDAEVRADMVTLPQIEGPGAYTAEVRWCLPDGDALASLALNYSAAEIVLPDPGYDRFSARRMRQLEKLAQGGNALALYRLNRAGEIDKEKIAQMCERIERRADCADFLLLPLLWLVWEDRGAELLEPELKESIRRAALGFRYWVDEPGTSSMFYCSENHRIGFHVCEYLAGLLYPSDMFTNCGQNGMYHSLKGRMHLVEWLNQRCRVGFDEPHSDGYLGVTMSALLVLREVLPMEEYPLRNMVNVLLDFLVFIYAVSDFDGVMATPRGRSYNKPLRTKMASGANGVFWLLFGNATANAASICQELAFSPYVPPKGICDLADHLEPANFTFKEGIMHFDKHNADFTLRRTPDYMIGGVRDHNVGMCDMHFISAMIALKNDISIFFSAPHNVAEGSGLRPDYWAGQAFLPRVLMAGRTLAVIWHNVFNPNIWMTHCHFNARRFDQVLCEGGWTFGRKADGYVAIYSSTPHSFRKEGLFAGRELVADGNETVWLAECGSKAEDGSFEAFRRKILGAKISLEGENFRFESPGSGDMAFGLTEGFTLNGRDVPIPEELIECPFLHSHYGSGRFAYTCPGYHVTQWSYPASE